MGFPIQNELTHNHSCGRALHHTVTAKACCDEHVLHPRDGSQDRIVVRRCFVQSRPPMMNPCLLKNRHPLDRIFHHSTQPLPIHRGSEAVWLVLVTGPSMKPAPSGRKWKVLGISI